MRLLAVAVVVLIVMNFLFTGRQFNTARKVSIRTMRWGICEQEKRIKFCA